MQDKHCGSMQSPGATIASELPSAHNGNWAPDATGCNEPAQRIVLSGGTYVGPEAKCRVVSVSETPSQTGPNYSARLEAPKGMTNLAIQPKGIPC